MALNARATIAQARGLLAETRDLSSADAFQRLRGYAQAHGLPLGKLARDLVQRTPDARTVLAGAPPR
ncbi:ANTAR domain-containing protein [Gandjariella thermophila]|uniref:ANTAR domain-containing protein n=1 Tax=Gandjariella thermophila TaxID=1931992 RepID=UPI001863F4A8|nr:ANTAR domain-containing protein [Gandjariella thermophila]